MKKNTKEVKDQFPGLKQVHLHWFVKFDIKVLSLIQKATVEKSFEICKKYIIISDSKNIRW